MRTSSGNKFSLGSAFGRRPDKHERQASYTGTDFGVSDQGTVRGNGGMHGDQPDSPSMRESGSGGAQLKKLGKTFAHNNLLPGLGNKDLKALQDVIAAEKGVLNNTERLAIETQKAAAVLPNYGLQEGPDLQDVLTQSSHLLNYFSAALNVYAERQVSLRSAYKKIRDREEAMMELKAYRRSTGSKAEQAERKLSKMGPENKGLQGQTELLERLRQEMRQLDTEIVKEETALGDFKRQTVKEAFMYKFSGLEELGEKLCIIGEMGKLVIDEIPMEETPVGYGRAPYGGFTKTESAVDEAGRCLGQVKFSFVETALKASHLPHAQHLPPGHGLADLPRQESIAAAEEFGHYPGNMPASPQTPGHQPYGNSAPAPRASYGLDENPYGGIENRFSSVVGGNNNAYGDHGGTRDGTPGVNEKAGQSETLWQGPTEDALRQQNRTSDGIEYAQARIASMYGHPVSTDRPSPPVRSAPGAFTPQAGPGIPEGEHDYEHQQQAEIDRQNQQEQAAWRDQPSAPSGSGLAPPLTTHIDTLPNPYDHADEVTPTQDRPGQSNPESALSPPWQPLNVKRGQSATPEPRTLYDPPLPTPQIDEPGPSQNSYPSNVGQIYQDENSDLAPPPSMSKLTARAPTPGTEGFRTPAESPNLDAEAFQHSQPTIASFSQIPAAPLSPPLPPPGRLPDTTARPASPSITSPIGGPGGKMSAGAFRKAVPRRSETSGSTVGIDDEATGSDIGRGPRRLPLPPGGGAGSSVPPMSPGIAAGPVGGWPDEKRNLTHREAFADVKEDNGEAPPEYGAPGHRDQDEGLR